MTVRPAHLDRPTALSVSTALFALTALTAMITIQFTRLPHGEDLPVPNRATEGAAGYDVVSADDGDLAPLERKLFRTGFRLAIPTEIGRAHV